MRRIWLVVLCCIVFLAAVSIFIWMHFTFGFVPLFILLLCFLALPLADRYLRRLVNQGDDDQVEEERKDTEILGEPAVLRYLAIAVFGGLSLWAFHNYVYPDEGVFRNSDYHALRVDGIELPESRMILAENSPSAFFDSDFIRGRLSVRHADSTGVTLEMNRFSEPVYMVSGNEMRVFRMLTTDGFPSFVAGDTVSFVTREGNTSTLRVEEHYRKYPWHYFISHYFRRERDSLHYYFRTPDGIEQVSTETRFLKSGLPMSTIMADVIQDFDPKGISIVRSCYDMNLKQRAVRAYYTNEAEHRNRYYVLLDAESDISEVWVNGVRQFPSRTGTYQATVPYGRPFVVGFGKHKSKTMCFNWENGALRLEYYLPEYRILTSSDKTVPDQTLMVATSLTNPSGEGLLDAYSDNIALLDQFDHPDNVFQMQPWFLSYNAGKSGVPLSFRVSSDATYAGRVSLDRYFRQQGMEMPGRGSGVVIPSEAYFPGVESRDGHVRWMVGVEDFSMTTPYRADRLSWLILLAVLLSVAIVRLGPVSISRNGSGSVVLNNDIEYAVFLIVIAFLTIRCFLMWRETVFPPVSSISFYEFNHFRDTGFFHWLLGSLFGFFALVIFVN